MYLFMALPDFFFFFTFSSSLSCGTQLPSDGKKIISNGPKNAKSMTRKNPPKITNQKYIPQNTDHQWNTNTLQEINISHLGKSKIIFKMPFFGGYASSQEGAPSFPSYFAVLKLQRQFHSEVDWMWSPSWLPPFHRLCLLTWRKSQKLTGLRKWTNVPQKWIMLQKEMNHFPTRGYH